MKSNAERLRAKEAALERRLSEIRKRRIAAENQEQKSRAPRRPVREFVLDLLMDAGFPMNSLLVASIIDPLLGKKITSSRFGTLSNDEEKSFANGRPRPVYLCHLLNADDGAPIKRYWARSDWPLEDRIYGPNSSRVLFLKGTQWAIELARSREDAADPDRLQYVAADQARSAGLKVTRGEFPYEEWLATIRLNIDRIEAPDLEDRREAAETLSASPQRALLFGVRRGLVSIPGTNARYRSA